MYLVILKKFFTQIKDIGTDDSVLKKTNELEKLIRLAYSKLVIEISIFN